MKVCFKCKEKSSYEFFFKHNQTSDGYHSWCKKCCTEGNIKSRNKQNATIEGRARVFLLNAKKSAAKRNQEFSLTIKDIADFWNEQQQICAYTGREMTLLPSQLNTVSIERIDSKVLLPSPCAFVHPCGKIVLPPVYVHVPGVIRVLFGRPFVVAEERPAVFVLCHWLCFVM